MTHLYPQQYIYNHLGQILYKSKPFEISLHLFIFIYGLQKVLDL